MSTTPSTAAPAAASTMLRTIDISAHSYSDRELRRIVPRSHQSVDSMLDTVRPIVEKLKEEGASAALAYSEKFDGIRPPHLRVPTEVCDEAAAALDPELKKALTTAITRVRAVHEAQKPADVEVTLAPGATVTQKFIPISRVGLYVPGGNAVYPSSVIMNVVPAQAAGVTSLVVASPPQKDNGGYPHPTVLAVCSLLGVDEVWAVGGAQAIGLLAYGDEGYEPVDLITGPGNIFVTAAKRLVRTVVGIDAEAGPTEIAILADSTADPTHVAYDLISQAEHDVLASSVLITDSAELALAVDAKVAELYTVTLNADRVAQALTGEQSAIVLTSGLDQSVAVANAYAAEHLEVHTRDAAAVAARITNAGAIFVGPHAPVPLGDYAAGSNHVLPTSGSARYSSGLSTLTFLKHVDIIDYDAAALEEIANDVIRLSQEERLPAHGEAITARRTK